ncbi:hypothetical protein ACA910_012941 [Epithemia clementina (nom. ined.)]
MDKRDVVDEGKDVAVYHEQTMPNSDKVLESALVDEQDTNPRKRKGHVLQPEHRSSLDGPGASGKLTQYSERASQQEGAFSSSRPEGLRSRNHENPSRTTGKHSFKRNRVEESPSGVEEDRVSSERSGGEGSQANSVTFENSDASLSNNAPAAAAAVAAGTAAAAAANEIALEEELDDERTAKREYNRVCAAKSRDKRKRTLLSLHAKVQAAASLFNDLLEKNKILRESIDLTFHETINGLIGGEGLTDGDRPKGSSLSTEKG